MSLSRACCRARRRLPLGRAVLRVPLWCATTAMCFSATAPLGRVCCASPRTTAEAAVSRKRFAPPVAGPVSSSNWRGAWARQGGESAGGAAAGGGYSRWRVSFRAQSVCPFGYRCHDADMRSNTVQPVGLCSKLPTSRNSLNAY
jgi:ribosomal protein L34E